MSVRASDAKRAYARAARPGAFPFFQLRIHVKGTVIEINLEIGLLEVKARRNRFMFERKHCLDKPGSASGGVEMPNVGFN
jgi:hypothetical protein